MFRQINDIPKVKQAEGNKISRDIVTSQFLFIRPDRFSLK